MNNSHFFSADILWQLRKHVLITISFMVIPNQALAFSAITDCLGLIMKKHVLYNGR